MESSNLLMIYFLKGVGEDRLAHLRVSWVQVYLQYFVSIIMSLHQAEQVVRITKKRPLNFAYVLG